MVGTSASCASEDGEVDSDAADAGTAAVTEFPGLEPAAAEATVAGLHSSSPAPGTVTQVSGPFDERFVLDRLRVGSGVVSGRLTITSDVSELLELEVVAGFYDSGGRFLGTARAVRHLDAAGAHEHGEGPPEQVEEFEIAAPATFAGRVSAAVVGVPVLVNE